MSLNWSNTKKEAETHGVKMLVFGRAGVGKTRLCGTAPRPLIISAEAGLLTLRDAVTDYGKGPEPIRVLVVKTRKDVDDALDWCRTDAAKHNIATLCLDSVSEIAEKVLADERSKTKDPRQAYGELAEQTIKLVKDFRDLPGFNVLITAKEAAVEDAITGATRAQPSSPGKQVGPQLPYLFDEVFHAATDKDGQGKTYHYLRTRASFSADAKDRSNKLDEIEYPDITNIINKIMS